MGDDATNAAHVSMGNVRAAPHQDDAQLCWREGYNTLSNSIRTRCCAMQRCKYRWCTWFALHGCTSRGTEPSAVACMKHWTAQTRRCAPHSSVEGGTEEWGGRRGCQIYIMGSEMVQFLFECIPQVALIQLLATIRSGWVRIGTALLEQSHQA